MCSSNVVTSSQLRYYLNIINNLYIKRVLQKRLLASLGKLRDQEVGDSINELKSIVSDYSHAGGGMVSRSIQSWIDITSSYFSITDCFKALHLITKLEQNAGRVAIHRLLNQGVIERNGKKDGIYRRIEAQAEEIDIFSTEDTPLNVLWPLGIEGMVKTMPKSIIVIAGESDAGKTAFCLNFSMMNLDNFKINYFSSEMGPSELKERISKFDRPLIDWKKVIFKERSSDFSDVIDKNSINIIDYLEMSDEFYKVGGQIKSVFDKLDKGIAIICLQKKVGSEFGRGGDFSMEKSRLYISLSRDNICKILKAKNWTNPRMKPAGKHRKYTLYEGCKFFPKSNWMAEGQEKEGEDA